MAKKTDLTMKVGIGVQGKPGVKTSEFWKSLVVHGVAIGVIAYGLYRGSDGIVQFGMILMAVTQGTYNIGRSVEKGALAKALASLLEERE